MLLIRDNLKLGGWFSWIEPSYIVVGFEII
jgi:hypothetical protein